MPSSTSAPSASVHGGATQKQSHKSSSVQTRVHHRDATARRKIVEALMSSANEDLCRAGGRVRECCRSPLILASPSGEVAVTLCRCRHRMCPTCSRLRSRDAADRVRQHVQAMNSPRFLTLTLAASPAPLTDQIDRLLSCFRQLRRRKAWSDHVVGGVATIECTWSEESKAWHPHLHVIVDGTFFPQPKLKTAWHEVTGDSWIVDVRKVNDATQAARYVASYMCKHGQVGSWAPERIEEYAAAMHGRRMLQTFGASHGLELDPRDEPDRPEGLEPIATVGEINQLAEEGSADARRVRDWAHVLGGVWRLLWPAPATAKLHPSPPDEAEILAAVVACGREIRRRIDDAGGPSRASPMPRTGTLFPRRMNV